MRVNGEGRARITREQRQGRNGMFYTYRIEVSSKNADGSFISGYMDARFSKGKEPQQFIAGQYGEYTDIEVKNAFLCVREYNGQDGKTHKAFYFMITAWEPAQQRQGNAPQNGYGQGNYQQGGYQQGGYQRNYNQGYNNPPAAGFEAIDDDNIPY